MTTTTKKYLFPVELNAALLAHRISVSPSNEPAGSGADFYAFAFDHSQEEAMNAFGGTPSEAVANVLQKLGVQIETEEEREAAYQQSMSPQKISSTAEIPEPGEHVYFFRAEDNPDKALFYSVVRRIGCPVFAMIGEAPEFMKDFVMSGYSSYELPEGTEPLPNCFLARPHNTQQGIHWGFDLVGQYKVEYC